MRKAIALIITILAISSVYSDECDDLLLEFIKGYNPMNVTNPITSAGTGYNDFGKYDLCLEGGFKYYLHRFQLNNTEDNFVKTFQVYMGLCIPEVCYSDEKFEDIRSFISKYTSIPEESIQIIKTLDENKKNQHFKAFTITVIIFIIIIFILTSGIIVGSIQFLSSKKGTAVQSDESLVQEGNNITISSEERPSIPIKGDVTELENKVKTRSFLGFLEACFDSPKNWVTLVELPKEKDIKAVYGIFTITFIILTFIKMSYMFTSYPIPIRNPEGTLEYVRNFIWQMVFNGDFCYDVLFFISGFYLAYKTAKSEEILTVIFVLKKILFKFLKLYPLYLITFLVYWKIFPFFLDGPVGGYLFNNEVNSCKKNWPFIVYMLQDLTYGALGKEANQNYNCFEWSWFIAALIHYYIIGIFLMFIYKKSHFAFYITVAGGLVAFLGIEISILAVFKYGITYYQNQVLNENYYFEYYYSKAYTRISTYLLGLLLGAFYYSQQKPERSLIKSIEASAAINIPLYILGIVLILGITLISYAGYNQDHTAMLKNVPLALSVLYNCFSRKLYVISVFLIMIPLLKKDYYYFGGFLNDDTLAYLNKMKYSSYLVMPIVLRFILLNARYQLYFDGWYILFYGIATVALSYVFGCVISLLLYVPMINIKRYCCSEPSDYKSIEEK